ncbi:serine protease inhibitor Kazal-type 13 [Dipodomys merriami]|uniref:serine protease inhibitor Kazal-type 13 n=1 Tax=Dipodomys merriami TaxID=94247 RepID=UPI00385571F0
MYRIHCAQATVLKRDGTKIEKATYVEVEEINSLGKQKGSLRPESLKLNQCEVVTVNSSAWHHFRILDSFMLRKSAVLGRNYPELPFRPHNRRIMKMRSRGCFLNMSMVFLLFSTLVHAAFAGFSKPRNYTSWLKPPCYMYHPVGPLYEILCPNITAFVCATNGLTYQNECFFCVDQWDFGRRIKFSKYGRCD